MSCSGTPDSSIVFGLTSFGTGQRMLRFGHAVPTTDREAVARVNFGEIDLGDHVNQ